MTVLAYENANVMAPLLQALQEECREGEWVIYRAPFRWKRFEGSYHDSPIMPNCYEMFPLESVLNQLGLEARYSFDHAAIVRTAAVKEQP